MFARHRCISTRPACVPLMDALCDTVAYVLGVFRHAFVGAHLVAAVGAGWILEAATEPESPTVGVAADAADYGAGDGVGARAAGLRDEDGRCEGHGGVGERCGPEMHMVCRGWRS